jgi:hypothetical protein
LKEEQRYILLDCLIVGSGDYGEGNVLILAEDESVEAADTVRDLLATFGVIHVEYNVRSKTEKEHLNLMRGVCGSHVS